MADNGVSCSLSRSGNVWDNAAMESFFSSLKTERTARKVYRTRDHARADVFDYIERFYNPQRRHSTIGYFSPMDFGEWPPRAKLPVHQTGSSPIEGTFGGEVRLLDDPDDFELLGGGVSPASSPPSVIMLFLRRRFSSTRSATTSFSALASRRSSRTSPVVADRAVPPAKRRSPASMNSFD